jgi:hypothetical protein
VRRYLSQRVLRVVLASAVLVGLAIGGTGQPASASEPVLLDSASYSFAYPDPSGNGSLPDPAVWNRSVGGGAWEIPVEWRGLVISDPDNVATLMYTRHTSSLSGDPTSLDFANTATFRVRSEVPYVSDGSLRWSAEAIGWRMILDDGSHRLELALSRSATYQRQVRIQNSSADPIDFPWDNRFHNVYEITRLANGDFQIALANADPSSPNPIHVRTIQASQVPPSGGVPQFSWGMEREGGGAAYWTEAYAEVRGPAVNQPPSLGAVTIPLDPVPVGAAVSAGATFTDPDASDTHTASWDWGDGTSSAGVVTEANGSGTVSGSHSYASAGVYPVTLTLTDSGGASAQAGAGYVVVYDPSAGSVSGKGSITSPAGAYLGTSPEGTASFALVSRYQKGASSPSGKTEFQFKAGGLSFRGDSYQWLVVAGARAQYKGSGSLNGQGGYGFLLTAIDGQVSGGGGVDRFRIKIWQASTGDVVYDNEMGSGDDAGPTTALSGGSIAIRAGGK